MSYRIPDSLIAEANAKRARRARRRLRRARPPARAARARHRGDHRQGRRLRRRRADLGRRHGRHALRPLSRARRAARRVRQARGLRDDPAADPRHADLLAAFPVGQGQRLSRARASAPRRSALGFDAVNSNTFQDQPGPEALLQVRLAHPRRSKAVRRPGGRAQSRMHRDRREARLEGADGLDRRRLQLPRPVEPDPGVRPLSRVDCAEIYARLPADWRVFLEHKLYEPAFYSTVISDWGTSSDGGAGAGPEGPVPGRPRPSRAERQHRADRRAADPLRQARRLPFQRFANTATTISTRARSTRSGCSACSTNSSTRPSARRRASTRPTCSTSRTTSPTRSKA